MFPLENASSQLLYSTVMIIATLGNGQESIGTGFFFTFKVDEQRQMPTIVTNKHVVAGATRVKFFVHQGVNKDDSKMVPGPESFPIEISDPMFIGHPGQVDLCAMPFEPLRSHAKSTGKDIFYISLDESLIPSEETLKQLGALEDIVMVGYPIGLWDRKNNFPIFRRGITASHPSTDFNGESIGVADIAAFPGSSGSPVILLNQGAYSTSGGGLAIGNRALLLGILFAGPQFTADGAIRIENIPTKKVPIPTVNIPVHLGYYVKVKELTTLKNEIFDKLKVR